MIKVSIDRHMQDDGRRGIIVTSGIYNPRHFYWHELLKSSDDKEEHFLLYHSSAEEKREAVDKPAIYHKKGHIPEQLVYDSALSKARDIFERLAVEGREAEIMNNVAKLEELSVHP